MTIFQKIQICSVAFFSDSLLLRVSIRPCILGLERLYCHRNREYILLLTSRYRSSLNRVGFIQAYNIIVTILLGNKKKYFRQLYLVQCTGTFYKNVKNIRVYLCVLLKKNYGNFVIKTVILTNHIITSKPI